MMINRNNSLLQCYVEDYCMYCFRFMGYVNMLGVAYESPTVATGYGMYIAQVQ